MRQSRRAQILLAASGLVVVAVALTLWRARGAARLAAEYGLVMAKEHVRASCDRAAAYTALVSPANQRPPEASMWRGEVPARFLGSLPGPATYEATLLNNPDDAGFQQGRDTDFILVVRVVGTAPGAVDVVHEIRLKDTTCRRVPDGV